jgi:hypothetical protein
MLHLSSTQQILTKSLGKVKMFFSKKPKTQMDKLKELLQRKQGVKSYEIVKALPSVSPHRRLSDLKERGWTITFKLCDDNKTKIYFGKPPKAW